MRTLTIFCCCIGCCLWLACPSRIVAQECNAIHEILTFDYRSFGIGIHRGCPSCELLDIDCHLRRLDCERLREQQILLGEPVRLWLEASHNAAANTVVTPIPGHIRARLERLFPPHILENVRYTTDFSAIGSLQWVTAEYQETGAVTLDNIIIFFDSDEANCDNPSTGCIGLWAHELEHVLQYDRLGIDGFAQAYVDQTCILPGNAGYDSDRCQIERRAKSKANLLALNRGFLDCCALRIGAAPTLELWDRVLNTTEEFKALDTITIGPNVTLQATGKVTLHAGTRILFNSGFHTEPGGQLFAEVVPGMARPCQEFQGTH